jgi:hypothetical protein
VTIETVLAAKSIWFLELRNINPRDRNLYRVIVPKLEQWYGFKAPQEFEEEKGVRFSGGEFSPSDGGDDLTGIELVIYNNGVVAKTSTSTEDSERFLEMLCLRLAKENTISYHPGMIRKKQYSSEVVARSDMQLLLPLLPQLAPVYAALSRDIYAGRSEFSWFGLVLDVDPLTPGKQVPFKFERRDTSSFTENLWYSHGPLSTIQHKSVLDALEKALAV